MSSEFSVIAVIRASHPSFRNHHDKISFAIHASFLAAGFSLIAVGRRALEEDLSIEEEEVGIEGWNELDDAYGFVYLKSEKGTKKVILVKCLPLEDYLMIDVVELKRAQKEPYHLQIHTKDYLADDVGRHTSYGEIYKDLQSLVKRLNTDILEKLEPKGNSATSPRTSQLTSNDKPGRDTYHGQTDPSLNNEPMPFGIVYPPVVPYGVDDLYPGPGAGFYPERGTGMGGSMLVGPNDPRFFRPGAPPRNFGGISGVPPGARFDPIGPPDVPGFDSARFIRQPQRPRGGVHPDLEHFQGSDFI